MTAPTIFIQNISLAYRETSVFSDLHLTLRAGKWTALLGASGVGKSSLLRLIAGLTLPEETFTGMITADNNIAISQQIAWMAQTDMLLPWLTVLDNLLLGERLRRPLLSFNTKSQDNTARVKARALLSQAGLAHAERLYPHQLSGGMRQRVALLRTLMEDKSVVLMDEPFSALDTITRYQLHDVAIKLLRDKTVLFVTHDPAEALRLADDIYLLAADGLQHLGSPALSAPRAPHAPEVVQLQKDIYAKLMSAAEVAA